MGTFIALLRVSLDAADMKPRDLLTLCFNSAEVFVLIIAGSLPTLRPIISRSLRSGNRGLFAAFKRDEESSNPSRYDGTTMAGTRGWELLERVDGMSSSEDLTALPQYPTRSEVKTVDSDAPTPASGMDRHTVARQSLGVITVQQDFSLAYERTPRDSMSLESRDRRSH